MNTSSTLEDALSLLEERGWAQGRYGDSDGGYCIAGAIYQQLIDTSNDWRVPLHHAVRALAQVTGVPNVAMWNDAPERTFSQVREVMRRAIAETAAPELIAA